MLDILAAEVPLSTLLSFGDHGYGDEIFWAALRTLEISLLGYMIGLLIGLGMAAAKISGPSWCRRLVGIYTTLFRALPELILIMLLYYAGTDGVNRMLGWLSLGPMQMDGMMVAILVLGFVFGAYAAEVFRGAISAIPIGQLEAATALGMSGLLRFRRITLPAMLPHALPGLGNLWLGITKSAALISIVGYTELVLATQQAAAVSKQYFTLYLLAQGIYLLLSSASSWLFGALEDRFSRGQRPMKAQNS